MLPTSWILTAQKTIMRSTKMWQSKISESLFSESFLHGLEPGILQHCISHPLDTPLGFLKSKKVVAAAESFWVPSTVFGVRLSRGRFSVQDRNLKPLSSDI